MKASGEVGATVVIGAGPAGLTAALELVRSGRTPQVLEQDPVYVGGLSRTVRYRGFRFDVGGHRFFSKSAEINALWREILGGRFRERTRSSRIYYRGRFLRYPLDPFEALRGLGFFEALRCVASYATARLRPAAPRKTFEDWVVAAFGRRLYEIFFKSYTEKVWGVPPSELSADWAAQRIQNLSMASLLRRMLLPSDAARGAPKTLIERFHYPPHGPGELWEDVSARVTAGGGAVHLGERVVRIARAGGRATAVVTAGPDGERRWPAEHVISTMPIGELVQAFDPPAPADVVESGKALRHRDFLTVAVVLEREEVFPDQWIYVHDPNVRVGRIQNFKNWSPDMVPDPRFTVLGLEYFCAAGDAVWASSDEELVRLAARELVVLGLAAEGSVVDAAVVRQPKAYPFYDADYGTHVRRICEFLRAEAPNVHLAGRNGLHKYDNQDHAMMTGLIAARNALGGSFDPWKVNADAEYLEEESAKALPEEDPPAVPLLIAAVGGAEPSEGG